MTLVLQQDTCPGTDRKILMGPVDEEEFGIFGFCYSYSKASTMRRELTKDFERRYPNNTSLHRQGERTTCLVSCALNAIPGLEVEIAEWSSIADCGYKWDMILHDLKNSVFYPIQIKSSFPGILKEYEIAMPDPRGMSYVKRAEVIARSKERILEKMIRRLERHCQLRQEDEENEQRRGTERSIKGNLKHLETEKIRARMKRFEISESVPIYIWADVEKADIAIKKIMLEFWTTFQVDEKPDLFIDRAIEDFKRECPTRNQQRQAYQIPVQSIIDPDFLDLSDVI